MKIFYATPYRSDINLGRYYNDFMLRLKDDEWACFTDGDSMFTTSKFGDIISDYVSKFINSNIGLFTCKTNRVDNWHQLHDGKFSEDFDIRNHMKIGQQLSLGNRNISILPVDDPLSGVMMLLKRSTWNDCKFRDGALGVDNAMHIDLLKVGYHVAIMNDLYVFHWYRGFNRSDRSHLGQENIYKSNIKL